MTTRTAKTIEMPCRNCGATLRWTADQLETHLRMLDRGEHAACACDDDCGALAPAWTREELEAARRQVREVTWWAWHDQDSARWSASMEEAERRCAAWVAGESDDGPARGEG